MINQDGNNAFPVGPIETDGYYKKGELYHVQFMKMQSGKIGMHTNTPVRDEYSWRVFDNVEDIQKSFTMPDAYLWQLKSYLKRKPKKNVRKVNQEA